jgi:hypothetical protein
MEGSLVIVFYEEKGGESPHRPFWLGLEKEVIVYLYNPIVIIYVLLK